MPEPPAPRRRRSAEEARRVILDAAQKRLTEGGPEAVRLQAIAADVGVSHPAILHHFGSRDGLLEALESRAMASLRDDLLRPGSTGEALDRVFETLGDQGHARLLAWWALSGSTPDGPGEAEGEPPMMRELAESVLEDLRAARAESGGPAPDADDAVFAVRLAAAALFGEALLGPLLSRSGGLPDGPETSVRFRRWLAELLERGLG